MPIVTQLTTPSPADLEALYTAFMLQHGRPQGLGGLIKQSVQVGNKHQPPIFARRDPLHAAEDMANFAFFYGLQGYRPIDGSMERTYRRFLAWYADHVAGR
jgi:hypothetical protein